MTTETMVLWILENIDRLSVCKWQMLEPLLKQLVCVSHFDQLSQS